ncbi:MAG: radical SAM protein [Verrucomicrobia bacterium]|nr:radical SAM protein [Verrucomicrobiota bacterium]
MNGAPAQSADGANNTVFGHPRDYLNKRFVYAVISQRAHGLSIGINLTPDHHCNFDCAYCEIDRDRPVRDREVDIAILLSELDELLVMAKEERMREIPWLRNVPDELLELKEVALSGDGEPTLCPKFREAVETVVHRRAQEQHPFKLVLVTNTTGLGLPDVQRALRLFASWDEIWVKLDAGTQPYMNRINRPGISLKEVLDNIHSIAKTRPVVVQSLFPLLDGLEPPTEEIEEYGRRLLELKQAGAQISLVQIYSAHRPPHRPNCAHLPLKTLSDIARRVRRDTGLRVEVF